MTTLITSSGSVPPPSSRAVVRDSNGNIIVAEGTATLHISTDGGSSWTSSGSYFSTGVSGHKAIAIDSADNIHGVEMNKSDNAVYYQQATLATDGTLTQSVHDEQIVAVDDSVISELGVSIAVDSTDIPWVVALVPEMIMGTDYAHTFLFDRGGGAWTDNGHAFDTGENDENSPSIAIDSTDTKHLVARAELNVHNYNTFSGGSFGTTEEPTGTSAGYAAPIAVDGSDVPFLATTESISGAATPTIAKRSGGTWSTDAYEGSATTVSSASVSFQNSEIQLLYEVDEDIYYNANTFGSFAAADRVLQVGSGTTDDYGRPNIRWAGHNNNAPATDVVDFGVFDSTNFEYEYGQISFAGGAVAENGAVAATGTPDAVTETAPAAETGAAAPLGTPSLVDATSPAAETGAASAVGTPDSTEQAVAVSESGAVSAAGTPGATEQDVAVSEAPSAAATGTPGATETVVAGSVSESGAVSAAGTPGATEQNVLVDETGATTATGTPTASPTAAATESGAVASTGTPTATEQDVAVSETPTVSAAGTPTAAEQNVLVDESGAALGTGTPAATETVPPAVEAGTVSATSTPTATEQDVAVSEAPAADATGTPSATETIQAGTNEFPTVSAAGTPTATEQDVAVSESGAAAPTGTPSVVASALARETAATAAAAASVTTESAAANEAPHAAAQAALVNRTETAPANELAAASPTGSPSVTSVAAVTVTPQPIAATATLSATESLLTLASESGAITAVAAPTVRFVGPEGVMHFADGSFKVRRDVDGGTV